MTIHGASMPTNNTVSKWSLTLAIMMFFGLPTLLAGQYGPIVVKKATSGAAENKAAEVSRLSLSPERIKVGMDQKASTPYIQKKSPFTKVPSAPEAISAAPEKALGAAHTMKRISEDASVWVSGFYKQGKMKAMYGAPASSDKHYGIVIGGNYYHTPSKQLFEMTFDFGLGNSYARNDHKLKNIFNSNQATLHYGLEISDNWKFNAQGSFMRIEGSHHRPYNSQGNRNVAVSHSRSHITSGMVEISHKHKPYQNFHLKSSFGGIYGHSKQFSHKEQNAGTNSKSVRGSIMNEAGLKVGLKGSFLHESDDKKIYGVYPHVSYTRFVKRGTTQQRMVALRSGQAQLTKSGTAGKDLLSVGIGVGIINNENSSKTQIGYTANFQKYRKSQEVMVKYSVQF